MADKLDISKIGVQGSFGSKFVEDPVATSADLPTNVEVGSLCWVLDENLWYEREANGTWRPVSDVGVLGSFQDDFVATEGQTQWMLTYTPVNLASVQAFIFGYAQDQSNLLALDGKQLTTVPTKAGTRISFRYARRD